MLLLVGGAVLRASLTDLYLRYVKEALQPFLIIAGIALVVIAIATLIPEFVKRDDTPEPVVGCAEGCGNSDHDHDGQGDYAGHAHKEPGVSWLMVLPVLALLLVAPPAMGSEAADRTGTALGSAAESDFPPLAKGDPAKIAVLDYAARAVFENGASLGDRRVELSGFVILGKDGQPYLARMILSCCAADARPIKVALDGELPQLTKDQWVRVVGSYDKRVVKDSVNGERIPFIAVEKIEKIPRPQEPVRVALHRVSGALSGCRWGRRRRSPGCG
ncbi:MAG: TIGR03943 family putative permease subunit [Micromonosporaceae bacterium]